MRADLDEDGDIALDELYSYVHERVVADMPQQRPKKQEDVDGRILIARNVHWTLPAHLRHALESPIAAQRLSVDGLAHLHRVGNDVVRATVSGHLEALAADDSRSVSAAAGRRWRGSGAATLRPTVPLPVAPTPAARRTEPRRWPVQRPRHGASPSPSPSPCSIPSPTPSTRWPTGHAWMADGAAARAGDPAWVRRRPPRRDGMRCGSSWC